MQRENPGLAAGAVPSLTRRHTHGSFSPSLANEHRRQHFCRASAAVPRPAYRDCHEFPSDEAVVIAGWMNKLYLVIGLLQRVSEAGVSVNGNTIASIGRGLLVLVAVQPDDVAADVTRLAERILTYRVFPDAGGRMNRSVLDESYELLLVPQFTLAANTRKGTRASFTKAAPADMARQFFDHLLAECRTCVPGTQSGEFGADMQVRLINDGPVTFWLQTA
jgi:D-tyrosyl-tRNA(Tyr) deacylase